MCFVDVLKAPSGALITRILVGVMDDGKLAISLLDVVLSGVLLHAKDLVEIFALCFLEFELCTADVVGYTFFAGISFLDRLVLAN